MSLRALRRGGEEGPGAEAAPGWGGGGGGGAGGGGGGGPPPPPPPPAQPSNGAADGRRHAAPRTFLPSCRRRPASRRHSPTTRPSTAGARPQAGDQRCGPCGPHPQVAGPQAGAAAHAGGCGAAQRRSAPARPAAVRLLALAVQRILPAPCLLPPWAPRFLPPHLQIQGNINREMQIARDLVAQVWPPPVAGFCRCRCCCRWGCWGLPRFCKQPPACRRSRGAHATCHSSISS